MPILSAVGVEVHALTSLHVVPSITKVVSAMPRVRGTARRVLWILDVMPMSPNLAVRCSPAAIGMVPSARRGRSVTTTAIERPAWTTRDVFGTEPFATSGLFVKPIKAKKLAMPILSVLGEMKSAVTELRVGKKLIRLHVRRILYACGTRGKQGAKISLSVVISPRR